MKVQILDNEKIVLYLYNYFFKSEEKLEITKEIKKIFIKLIKYYNLKIGGVYNVLVYDNKNYGTILEIEKTSELLFNPDLIDIKVKIFKDNDFYLKTKDYFEIAQFNNIYYDGNYYYLDISKVSNIIFLIEFGSIEYNISNSKIEKMILIK